MRAGNTQTNAASNMWISLLAVFPLFFLAGCAITENVDPKYDPPAVAGTQAELGMQWNQRKAGEGRLSGIAWSGNQFAAVGYWWILTSSDGLAWKSSIYPRSRLNNITWDGSQFVAVGYEVQGGMHKPSTPLIVTSADGVDWTQHSAPASAGILTSVAWSGKQFVAVGWGDPLTSSDGVTWNVVSLPVEGRLESVVWGTSQFVAVGQVTGSKSLILTSLDGTTWTPLTTPGKGLGGVVWSGERFVAVGNGTILTSLDGSTWDEQKMPVDGELKGVTWSGTQLVAVGRTQPSTREVTRPLILTSTDGVTWTQSKSQSDGSLWAIVWNGTRFVAVGQTRSGRYYDALIMTSP